MKKRVKLLSLCFALCLLAVGCLMESSVPENLTSWDFDGKGVLEEWELDVPDWVAGTKLVTEYGYSGKGLALFLERVATGTPFWARSQYTYAMPQDWSEYEALQFYMRFSEPAGMFAWPEVVLVESNGSCYTAKGTGGYTAVTYEEVGGGWYLYTVTFDDVYRPSWSPPDDNDKLDLNGIAGFMLYPCVLYSYTSGNMFVCFDEVQLVPSL